MLLLRRMAIGCLFILALGMFAQAPALLALDAEGMQLLTGVATLGGPLAALVFCLLAARASEGSDRAAWVSFALGSACYLAGNLCYLYLVLAGIDLGFPTAPEGFFFAMALFFVVGIFQYGKVRKQISRLQLYNFVLIYCAVALASLFTLGNALANSVLTPFGTIVAFLYPALWFSVAASGLISLLLYSQGSKAFPFGLLLLAVFAESVSDYIYALALMDGTYQIGGATQLLWIASSGLVAWAALEHMALGSRARLVRAQRRAGDRGIAQAAVPAAAVGMILLAGSISGALGSGPYVWLSGILAIVFAVMAGLREHWIIHIQRNLRRGIDAGRRELARSQEQLRTVLDSTSDSVLVVDRDWKVVFFNQQAVETTRREERLRIGVSLWDLFPAAKTSGEADHYLEAVRTGVPAAFELFAPEHQAWLGINAYPTPEGLSIFFRDISEARRIREEITHLAHHDALTGLANRAQFQQRLVGTIGSGAPVAVLLIDLDHFKEVNDTLGHPVGDALLRETANRLRACARPADLIARLGGDEFALILVDHAGKADIKALAGSILALANAPHLIDGQSIRVAASVGIALASGAGDDPDEVFKRADIALYVAKARSRGGFRFFEPAMETGVKERQALRHDLADALARGEFSLAYQPIVDLATNSVCSFEALLRWTHPVRGPVTPDQFIAIAEETGQIVEIGDWVLRTACAEAARWPSSVSVAVNLSTKQFGSGDLIERIDAALSWSGLDPSRLELEITESVLLNDSRANLLTLKRLGAMGIRIALDDFGTGYSSLGYLQRFAFSKIKIDRSFIAGLPANDESQVIVRSVIGLGQSLGMRVTAEGVETAAQLDWIRTGCDEAQGYLIGRPIAADAIAEVLDRLGVATPDATPKKRRAS